MAPIFENFASKYPRAVFLKVDVDECQETAGSQGVTAMPTFIFYRNKVKLGSVQGADAAALEAKIVQFIGDEEADEDSGVVGHVRPTFPGTI
jgi:thiol-disulfide isomerase/thioredoxin